MIMKTVFYKHYPLLTLCLFLCIQLMSAQTVERKITKNFPLSPNGKLAIDNSYGTVKLNSWDKDEVAIEVIIKVNASSEERAEDALENIEIDFDASADLVRATTLLEKNKTSWWSGWSFFGVKRLDYSINYLVQMPKTAALDIENDYGNIYLDETDGATQLSCAYGRLEVGKLNHTRNEIEIAYAPNSEIEFVNEAVIEADYSGLKIDQANKIEYDADYSKSSFGLVAILDFEADYGSLRLDEGNILIGEADYLTIKIGRLSSKLDLDMDYGSLSVEEIATSTKEVTVQADYTGIRLGADPDWDFAFTIETEYAGFKTDFPLDYRKKIIESTDRYYQGKHRNGINQLNLSADYGSIKLTQN